MTELPDDNLLPGAFSGEHFSDLRPLAVGGEARPLNPAMAYLLSLPSAASRQTMRSFLH
ncbi:integrase, partial [Enterobacter kobei]|nr:integrase [Enterobacter kobei]